MQRKRRRESDTMTSGGGAVGDEPWYFHAASSDIGTNIKNVQTNCCPRDRPKQRCNTAPFSLSRRLLSVLMFLLMACGESSAHSIKNENDNNLRASGLTVTVSPSTRVANAPRAMQMSTLQNNSMLVFAVVPKTTDNPYFTLAENGCMDQASRMTRKLQDRNITVVCEYVGPLSNDTSPDDKQIEWMRDLLYNDTIAGIAVSVRDETTLIPALEELMANLTKVKPVVTFDSDLTTAPTLRYAYVGTNNSFFGIELARALLQLHPTVGRYGILQSGSSPNMIERRDAFIKELDERKPGWTPLPDSPGDAMDNLTIALERLNGFANQNPDAIVSLMGLPMRQTGEDPVTGDPIIPWQDMYNAHIDKNIEFLCGDAMSHQLDLLGAGYVQALIGQLPHEMGMMSIEILYNISTTGSIDGVGSSASGSPVVHSTLAPAGGETTTGDGVFLTTSSAQQDGAVVTSIGIGGEDGDFDEDDNFIGTNCLSHIFIPLVLPDNDAPNNRLENLKYVGYSLFGIMCLTAFVLLHWTINYRKVRVVQVAQPKFLAMVIVGVLIMSSCLIPLSIDDGGEADSISHYEAIWICMSVPWLASIGFTMTFSALYAKTRRINKIFHSNSAFARVKVSETEVLLPFTILLFCNFAVLIAWTAVDPLTYTRVEELGSDGWSRVLSTYGGCRSDYVERYLIPLAILNLGCLIMANWQAFEARHIEAEFSETKYIAICMASMLQAAISGIPVLFVVKENPQAFYLVLVFMIFIIGMVILLVIFVPKIMFAKLFMAKSEVEQKDFISFLIQQSSRRRKYPPNRFSESQQGSGLGHPGTYQGYQPGWASTAYQGEGAVPYPFQSQYGASQFGTSQYEPASSSAETAEEVPANGSTETDGTGRAPPNHLMMSHITEGSHENEEIDGVHHEEGFTGHIVTDRMSHMSHITEGSTEREHRSTQSGFTNDRSTRSGFTNDSGSTPSGQSMRSLKGRSSHHRPFMRPSFHHPGRRRPSTHHPRTSLESANSHHSPLAMKLDSDDGEDGMLVYRTMSIMPDGSVHTRHSHLVYDFLDDDMSSFYIGTPDESFRTLGNDSGNSGHRRTMNSTPAVFTSNNLKTGASAAAPLKGNNNMTLGSSSAHSAKTHPKPNATRRTPRRVASDGPRRVQHRLPSLVLNAIKEKKHEDSESSDRSSEIMIDPNGSSLRSSSHHTRILNASNSDLNCIPEVAGSGDFDDDSDSFKSAELYESEQLMVDDAFESVELFPVRNNVMTDQSNGSKEDSNSKFNESLASFASDSNHNSASDSNHNSEGVIEEAPNMRFL